MSATEEQENFLHETLSGIIRDAFFDARNAGQTMYHAGDDAAARVLSVLLPSALRLQSEVDSLITRWEAERQGTPTDDWQHRVADSVLSSCLRELRTAVARATPTMPSLERT
jgi:hypothetical protein